MLQPLVDLFSSSLLFSCAGVVALVALWFVVPLALRRFDIRAPEKIANGVDLMAEQLASALIMGSANLLIAAVKTVSRRNAWVAPMLSLIPLLVSGLKKLVLMHRAMNDYGETVGDRMVKVKWSIADSQYEASLDGGHPIATGKTVSEAMDAARAFIRERLDS